MAIIEIDSEEFNSRNPARSEFVRVFATEKSWFADTERNIIGTILFDHTDKDWNYVILARHEDGLFRWIDGDSSLKTQNIAEQAIQAAMTKMETTDQVTESIFKANESVVDSTESTIQFTDINTELKRYFSKHPEHLYDLSPRKFEELIASILEDLGFDVELTQATRDGGSDIIAYIRNAVCEYLTLIECKKYAADRKVGVGVIREVSGVHHLKRASKSLIITTSFFSKDAIKEALSMEHQLQLKDYEDIKNWLMRYS
ncbi:restriction endonuclease [bacterium]|nr:restriction endonuclease [bacterium]